MFLLGRAQAEVQGLWPGHLQQHETLPSQTFCFPETSDPSMASAVTICIFTRFQPICFFKGIFFIVYLRPDYNCQH